MSNSIKFEHSLGGAISQDNGTTSLSDLFSIGAMALTTRRNSETSQLEYATDIEGLEIVAEKADFAANFLTNSVRSIGILLANAEVSEIEHEIKSISWLITGLSELAIMVNDAQSDMNYVIEAINKKNNGDDNE